MLEYLQCLANLQVSTTPPDPQVRPSSTHLHPDHGVLLGVGLVQQPGVLHVLGHALQEGERLVEHHRHRDLGQLLADALLQHRPQREVVPLKLLRGETGSGGEERRGVT